MIKINKKYIIIFSLFILFIIFIYFYYIENLENYENNSANIYALTFGGGGKNYYDAASRFENELLQINIFISRQMC